MQRRKTSTVVGQLVVVSLTLANTARAQDAAPKDERAPPAQDAAEPTLADSAEDSLASERLRKLEEAVQAQAEVIGEQEREIEEIQGRLKTAEEASEAAQEAASLSTFDVAPEEEVADERLRFYGFADMAFTKRYIPEDSRFSGLIDRSSTFAMGNVNLYIDAQPNPDFRFLAELRFTLFPHGDLDDNFEHTDTRTFDSTSATGRNNIILSGTVIERAYIEWKKYDTFKLRAGYFLTPYGIWNVDHGSPTLISSVLPTFWASEYFPTRQVGVQALGELFYDRWEYGYRAYVSNGRPDESQTEIDPFKMFGGRLYARYTGDVTAQIGTSGFYNQEARSVRTIESFDPFLIDVERTEQVEEFGVAADASLDVSDLRLRAEFVLNQQEYRDGYRRATSPVTFQRDQTRYNSYTIASYRLPWAGLEPFTFIEYAKRPTASDNSSWVVSGGVIEHLAPGTQFKFQAFYVHFPDDKDFPEASDADFPGWDMRLVTVF